MSGASAAGSAPRRGLALALTADAQSLVKLNGVIGQANVFRVIFFILTFFSIGALSNFHKAGLANWRRSISSRCSASSSGSVC